METNDCGYVPIKGIWKFQCESFHVSQHTPLIFFLQPFKSVKGIVTSQVSRNRCQHGLACRLVCGPPACVCVHPTLCNSVDHSPPASSLHGILQARLLEWVAVSSPRGTSWPRDRSLVCCVPFIGRRIFTPEPLAMWPRWHLMVKNPPASAGDIRNLGSIHGWGRSCGGGNGNPLKHSVQFSLSVVSNSLPPVVCSTPGFPVHHQLLELTQTRVHLVGDTIQPSHPLKSPSLAFNHSQHQGLF